jgi:hypothetical protein
MHLAKIGRFPACLQLLSVIGSYTELHFFLVQSYFILVKLLCFLESAILTNMKILLSEEIQDPRKPMAAEQGRGGVLLLERCPQMRGSHQNLPLQFVPSLDVSRRVAVHALMNSGEQNQNISRSLEIIAKYVAFYPASDPVRFVLDLAHHWKERGGALAGKARHSDRYLVELLRLHGTQVKSLTPKLAGRTHLKPTDAESLVRVFLSHWDYVGDPDSGEIGGRPADLYEALLPDDHIKEVASYIADQLLRASAGAKVETGHTVTSTAPLGQEADDIIATEFREAAGFFTVGAGQTVLVDQPEMALIGFRNLMDRLWSIERHDEKERVLVWILELGRQDFEDPESRLRFMNVEALISRFKALMRFKEAATEERWGWLQSKTVILLHDTRSARPDIPRLPAFDPHHVLFSAIPTKWAGSSEFLALYGNARLHEASYTIFLKRKPLEERNSSAEVLPHRYELRFFGHALLGSGEKGKREARGLELNVPGRSYVEALGTVFVAATQMLGLGSIPAELSINGMKLDTTHAVEKLRHHGFLLLRLDEFMKF